jgi:hypothetical protein
MSIYKVRVRRDTALRWSTVNPTLDIGEIGFETDTKKIKVGNGETSWNTLDYVSADAASHTQAISTITGLQDALDAKANSTHSHAISDVADLQTSLDAKAASVHTHYISEVTNLQTTLNNKADLVHSHSISDTAGLQLALDAKSDLGHGHAYYEVEQDFHFQSSPPSGMAEGSRWMDSNTGIEYTYLYDGDSYQWVQSAAPIRLGTGFNGTRLVSTSGYYANDSDYYIGINYSGVATVVLQSDVDDGRSLIIKDESGYAGYANRYITVSGAAVSGLIDNRDTATININNGSLQLLYRDGWRII